MRITFDAKRDHVKALAILSTYKNICMGINFGGAHGALQIMKKDFKEDEIKRMMELYAKDVSRKLNFGIWKRIVLKMHLKNQLLIY